MLAALLSACTAEVVGDGFDSTAGDGSGSSTAGAHAAGGLGNTTRALGSTAGLGNVAGSLASNGGLRNTAGGLGSGGLGNAAGGLGNTGGSSGGPPSGNGLSCDLHRIISTTCLGCYGVVPNLALLATRNELLAPSVEQPGRRVIDVALARVNNPASPMLPSPLAPVPASDVAWVLSGTPAESCGTNGGAGGAGAGGTRRTRYRRIRRERRLKPRSLY